MWSLARGRRYRILRPGADQRHEASEPSAGRRGRLGGHSTSSTSPHRPRARRTGRPRAGGSQAGFQQARRRYRSPAHCPPRRASCSARSYRPNGHAVEGLARCMAAPRGSRPGGRAWSTEVVSGVKRTRSSEPAPVTKLDDIECERLSGPRTHRAHVK